MKKTSRRKRNHLSSTNIFPGSWLPGSPSLRQPLRRRTPSLCFIVFSIFCEIDVASHPPATPHEPLQSLPHGPHLCPGCMYVACIHFCVIRNVLVTNHSRGARARERAPGGVQTIFSAAGRRRLDRRPLIFPVGRGLTRGWPVPRTKLVTPSAAPQQPAFSLHADSTLARTEAARELRQAYKGAAARMSSPYVGRSLSRTRGDGMCGGTPFVLVGSCVAARYDRQVRAAWSCVHASKTSPKFKGTRSVQHAFLHSKRPA